MNEPFKPKCVAKSNYTIECEKRIKFQEKVINNLQKDYEATIRELKEEIEKLQEQLAKERRLSAGLYKEIEDLSEKHYE